MSEAHQLKFYGYVDRPYEGVRNLLRAQAGDVLQRATRAASGRANSLVARLYVDGRGFELGVDVVVHVTKRLDDEALAGLPPITHFGLSWKAATHEGLFPSMSADLALSPMTFAETRIEFEGVYRPPLAVIGKVFDAAVGHRIAEAAVHQLVNDLIEQIRRELPAA
jgi:hypothetical protein